MVAPPVCRTTGVFLVALVSIETLPIVRCLLFLRSSDESVTMLRAFWSSIGNRVSASHFEGKFSFRHSFATVLLCSEPGQVGIELGNIAALFVFVEFGLIEHLFNILVQFLCAAFAGAVFCSFLRQ